MPYELGQLLECGPAQKPGFAALAVAGQHGPEGREGAQNGDPVTTGAEMGGIQPQAKQSQRQAATRDWKEQGGFLS